MEDFGFTHLCGIPLQRSADKILIGLFRDYLINRGDGSKLFGIQGHSNYDILGWIDSNPEAYLHDELHYQIFKVKELVQLVNMHVNPISVELRTGPETFMSLRQQYQQFMLEAALHFKLGDEEVEDSMELVDQAVRDFLPASTAVILEEGLPPWFTYPKQTGQEETLPPSEKPYPSGVFLMPRSGFHQDVGILFEHQLFISFERVHNLANRNSWFMCFDSSVVPQGLFDGTCAAFIPTEDPLSAAKVMLLIADSIHPVSNHDQFALRVPPKGMPLQDQPKVEPMLQAMDVALRSFSKL